VKALSEKLTPDGSLWVVRPKGKDGVSELAVFAAGHGARLVDVKVAKWNETDTGHKFVLPKADRAKRDKRGKPDKRGEPDKRDKARA
jgi:hypothetical protein